MYGWTESSLLGTDAVERVLAQFKTEVAQKFVLSLEALKSKLWMSGVMLLVNNVNQLYQLLEDT
jgi:hypothetical protein